MTSLPLFATLFLRNLLLNSASKGENVVASGAFTSEAELLAGLQAEDPAAYRRLVELNSANVYNVALKPVTTARDPAEVSNE